MRYDWTRPRASSRETTSGPSIPASEPVQPARVQAATHRLPHSNGPIPPEFAFNLTERPQRADCYCMECSFASLSLSGVAFIQA